MSLAGLLNILDDDPQLRDVLARAGASTDPVDTDLVAPPTLRPVLAAALSQGGRPSAQGQRTGFVLGVLPFVGIGFFSLVVLIASGLSCQN